MSKRLAIINIILAIADLALSALGIIAFAWAAMFFNKWWLIFFALIPLAMYSQHSMIIDSDIRDAKVDELQGKGGEEDS